MAYTMEKLLSVLHPCCPAKADALCKNSQARRTRARDCGAQDPLSWLQLGAVESH